MKVGICDDEAIIRDELSRLCKVFMKNNMVDLEIITFTSGEELLLYKEALDVIFLDVQMEGMDGLETAKKLRLKDSTVFIIFVTGYSSYIQEGYRVRAYRYLLKPLLEVEFMQALGEAIKDIKKETKVILGQDGKTSFVKLRDIMYIEHINRNTLVRTLRHSFESTFTMSDWERTLDNGDFYRVHKSFIVNMQYVEEIEKEIVLENGEKVELAYRQATKFKKACREYRRRNAR